MPLRSIHVITNGRISLFLIHCSVTKLCLTLQSHGLQHTISLSFTNSQILLRFMLIESVMLSNHLILCQPLLLLPPLPPRIRVFSNELVLHIRWPKYWSFSFSISPSNKYSGLISFRIDWFDLLAVQGTLKSSPAPQFKKHRFSGAQPSLWSNSHICTPLLKKKKNSFDYTNLCQQSEVSVF